MKDPREEATSQMSTNETLGFRLVVLASRLTFLGLKASVALYKGDEQVFCDEAKLWNATSRENFSKRCLKILGLTAKTEKGKQVRSYIDQWLRAENRGY